MSLDQLKKEKLEAAKVLFRQAIHDLGINSGQDQFTSLHLMLLAVYEGCVEAGIQFDFTVEEMAHVERARQFKNIKERSKLVKSAIRAAKSEKELDAVSIEDW